MEGVLTSFARVKSTMASQRLIHTKGKLETNLHYIYIYIYIMFVVVVSKFRGPLSLYIYCTAVCKCCFKEWSQRASSRMLDYI